MGRVKMNIKKSELEKAIQEVERNGPLKNRNALHDAVAKTDWAKNHSPKPVTASVVGLRIAEFNIDPVTPFGRIRTPKSVQSPVTAVKGKPVSGKKIEVVQKKQLGSDIFQNLRVLAPSSYYGTIELARKGNKTAIIELNCARCVGFEDIEENVRGCMTQDCPMHHVRPFQNLTVNGK